MPQDATVNNSASFTQVPNGLLEHLCKTRIAARERQVLDMIIRQTYGYHRQKAGISYAQFSDGTGLVKRAIRDCVSFLEKKKIIIVVAGGFRNSKTYSINEDFDSWTVQENMHSAQNPAQCIKSCTHSAQNPAQSLCTESCTPTIKEKIKKTLKKDPEKISGEFKKKSFIPKNYEMADYHLDFAQGKGFDLKTTQAMFEKFRAHHEAKGSKFKSWRAAWRTWVLNQIQYHGVPVPQENTPTKTDEEQIQEFLS